MKIQNCKQVDFDKNKSSNFNLLFTASGFESRSIFFAENYSNIMFSKKVVLSFDDRKTEGKRIYNDEFFKKNSFEEIICDGDSETEISNFLDIYLSSFSEETLSIFIDYSCMTRIWYATIIKYFISYLKEIKSISLYFVYSIAKYTEPKPNNNYNIHIGPIKGFSSLSVPQKPTALIIGLGYEKNKAMGLIEYFDSETFLFYTDDSNNSLYKRDVENNNNEIIGITKKENIYTYPISNLDYTFQMLRSLCTDLSNKYRIIIAPCGPKIFTLLSIVNSFLHNDIDVWRISAGKESEVIDKVPEGEVLFFKIDFN